jgi:hypothetical protein
MTAHFVVLSDLHLGYDRSVLNDLSSQERLASSIADLCSGETDRLILNGDAFESCVPKDAGRHDEMGFSPFMSACSRNFFEAITSKVKISSLIIVWGNHDYAMWERLASNCGVGTFTNHTKGDVVIQGGGQTLKGSESFLNNIIGGRSRWQFDRIRSAYPNYILGRSWPYLTFHHGHFLDDLILGQESDAKYAGLQILTGVGRPDINLNEDNTLISIHEKTRKFISSMWAFNSKAREVEWALLRRGTQAPKCDFYPSPPTPSLAVIKEHQSSSLGNQATWYADLLLSDSTTPSPLGLPFSSSYLFVGHDHGGGFKKISGMDNRNWELVNTGGWTMDDGRKEVHSHVTLWKKQSDYPESFCVSV